MRILNQKDVQPQFTATTSYSLDSHGHLIFQLKSIPIKFVILTPSKIKDKRVFSREKLANRDCRIVVEKLENLVVGILCCQSGGIKLVRFSLESFIH